MGAQAGNDIGLPAVGHLLFHFVESKVDDVKEIMKMDGVNRAGDYASAGRNSRAQASQGQIVRR